MQGVPAEIISFVQRTLHELIGITLGGSVRLRELHGLIKEVGGLKKFKYLLEAISGTETDTAPF